jgi:hypothetical protein
VSDCSAKIANDELRFLVRGGWLARAHSIRGVRFVTETSHAAFSKLPLARREGLCPLRGLTVGTKRATLLESR